MALRQPGAVDRRPEAAGAASKAPGRGARDLLLDALPAETLQQKRDRAFVLFLLSTGARIAEALRLDRRNWQPGRMRVIGKGDRERTVVITEKARVITEKARQAMEQYLEARTDPSPALFIGFQPAKKNSAGNRLTVQGANHICHQLALRLGIPQFHPHRLRHTLGTFL